jgi:DNA sulfur modification protein DndD
VILKEVVLENFGPYCGRTAVDLAPRGRPGVRPITLIGALNGSGKTSLLDGLLLALYGSRARCSTRRDLAYPTFLRDSINARAPKEEGASVSVAFDYLTSQHRAELRVTRSWRITGKGVVETCQVERNGVPDVELSETWAERVEGIVPLGISNLFFFDGEQVGSIASSEAPTEEVKSAIRTLLNIDLPDQLREDLQVIAARRRRALVKEPKTRARHDEVCSRLRDAIATRSALALRLGELKNAQDAADRRLIEIRDEFTAVGGAAAGQRPETEEKLEATRRRLEACRERLRELAAGPLPLALILPLLKRTEATAERDVRARDEASVARFLGVRDSQVIKSFREAGAEAAAVALLDAVLTADRERRFVRDSEGRGAKGSANDLAVMRRAVAELHDRTAPAVRETLREIAALEVEARRFESQLTVAAPDDTVVAALARLAEAQATVGSLKAESDAVRERHSQAQRLCHQLEDELAKVNAELTVDSAAMDEDSRIVRAADRVNEVMKEFRERLLRRRVQELERHILERFRHLHRKVGSVGRVEIDQESFQLHLFDPEGLPINRERMSAGEQQLLAVSFLWGLALASGRQLPVVVDTPLGRMDHTHRRNLVERYFPMASHQVVLLSTDAEVDQEYHRLLHSLNAVDREYRLEFDPARRDTQVAVGYFWNA